MKKFLSVWQIAGFVFTGTAGVLLHFLFDWTGGNIVVAPISAVNESIWEHIKLLFFPMLTFALIQNRNMGWVYPEFWCVKLIGILLSSALIPVLYYTVNGSLGQTPDWVNIAIFFVTAAIGYFIEWWLFKRGIVECKSPKLARLILLIVALVFVIWTFTPPRVPLFKDPITNTYGFYKVLF